MLTMSSSIYSSMLQNICLRIRRSQRITRLEIWLFHNFYIHRVSSLIALASLVVGGISLFGAIIDGNIVIGTLAFSFVGCVIGMAGWWDKVKKSNDVVKLLESESFKQLDTTKLVSGSALEIVNIEITQNVATNCESVIRARKLDERLFSRRTDIAIRVVRGNYKKKQLHKQLREKLLPMMETYLLGFLNNPNASFYNSTLAELETDIFYNPNCTIVDISKTNFFNYISSAKISSKFRENTIGDRNRLDLFKEIYPIGNDNQIIRIDDMSNIISNVIGVNTLAVTSCKEFVIWRQGSTNFSSADLLVPTGSGSLDFADYKKCVKSLGRNVSFSELLSYGATREMSEENRLTREGKSYRFDLHNIQNAIANTWQIGGYRWCSNGAKPDFIAVTKLDISKECIMPDENEVVKTRGDNVKTFTYAGLKLGDTSTELITNIDSFLTAHKDISVPLFYTLTRIKQILEESLITSNSDARDFARFLGLNA